jgi:predicted DNA repair protein MutK
MASSLLALLDDIATLLDDVALLTKVAAQKTTGVLGDDLALNAQQVAGVNADRELPVVWAVCKGSLWNKLILVPSALVISLVIPWAVTPLLMVGGAYLCFEGFEKIAHKFLHRNAHHAEHQASVDAALLQSLTDPAVDVMALEKDKIQGAIRTDFILSAEIIAITLGTVQASVWPVQLAVLSGIALVMTVGVYGAVAGIVKLDDAGLYLSRLPGSSTVSNGLRSLGHGVLHAAPWLMKALSVAGTVAMFLVGGGILVHGLPFLHHSLQGAASLGIDALTGLVAGAVVLMGVTLGQKMLQKFK